MDNPNNRLITKSEVEDILNYFGNIGNDNTKLTISNLEHFQRAFVHESYYQSVQNAIINGQVDERNTYISYMPVESSERLEFLGDHILKGVMGRYLHERFGDEREGFLTKLKIKIERCCMLHQIGVTLGFRRFLLLSLQVENQTILDRDRGRGTPSYYEDAFEAFVGAISMEFGEQGYIYAERFVRGVIENVIDFAEINSKNDNFKDSLQRWFQQNKYQTPVYTGLNEDGPLYRKVFTRMLTFTHEQFLQMDTKVQNRLVIYTNNIMEEYRRNNPDVFTKLLAVRNNDKYILGIGFGRKVTEAEQACAKGCLQNLGLDLNF
uniref:RNase III domain-containing protein n=1 Tax=viral metagenome TaxID=1070528 RepID=A0A6C0H7B8_9ZZZZ